MATLKDKTRASSLEDFVLLGAVKEEKEVFDNKVIMQTLPSGFIKKLAIESSGLDMFAKDKVFKVEILARAIKKLNGQPLVPDAAEDEDQQVSRVETIDKIKKIIGKWEQPLVDIFYALYEELAAEQKEFFEQLKKKFEKKTG